MRSEAGSWQQHIHQPLHRVPSVEDVIDDEDMPLFEVRQGFEFDDEFARRGRGASVAARLDKTNFERQINPPDKIGNEHD